MGRQEWGAADGDGRRPCTGVTALLHGLAVPAAWRDTAQRVVRKPPPPWPFLSRHRRCWSAELTPPPPPPPTPAFSTSPPTNSSPKATMFVWVRRRAEPAPLLLATPGRWFSMVKRKGGRSRGCVDEGEMRGGVKWERRRHGDGCASDCLQRGRKEGATTDITVNRHSTSRVVSYHVYVDMPRERSLRDRWWVVFLHCHSAWMMSYLNLKKE